MNEETMIHEGPPYEGFFVYSSEGCGDEVAIRIKHIQDNEQMISFALSPKEATTLGKLLIKVAAKYENGEVTGIGNIARHRD